MDAQEFESTDEARTAIKRFYSAIPPGAITYYSPDSNRGPLLVGVLCDLNFRSLAAAMTPEETATAGQLSAEWLFRQCDEVTRRTGLLTKYTRLIDLRDVKLSNMSREFQRRDRESSKMLEDFYPQLLEAVYLCHAPSWLQTFWRGIRPLLPVRFVEKVDFISPQKSVSERKRVLRHVAHEPLPVRFGGGCTSWPLPNARQSVHEFHGAAAGPASAT